MTRRALLVGTATYDDPEIPDLTAPHKDVAALAEVLADPAIGDYRVAPPVLDATEAELRNRIGTFFAEVDRDDDLLLHFACHGLVDDDGQLYLAAADSRKDDPLWTGLDVRILANALERSRARQIVVLLDCCFSARFFDALARGDDGPTIVHQIQPGRGHAVLAACGKLQRAYEESTGSRFMNAVLTGLRTGAADLDRDGWVSVDDLHTYVHDAMRDVADPQRPMIQVVRERELLIARNPHATPAAVTPARPDAVEVWTRGGEVRRGENRYVLSHPLYEERSDDEAYLWRWGRARDLRTRDPVWLREVSVLVPGPAAARRRQALLRECRLLGELDLAPGFPRRIALHQDSTGVTLTHTAVTSPSIRSVFGTGGYPLPAPRIGSLIEVLASACDVLTKLHTLGRSHRELTPDTVHVGERGVELRDLGLAALRSVVGEGIGPYRAPEQNGGTPGRPGSRLTDIYQVAAIGYEILTGEPAAGPTPAPVRGRNPAVSPRLAVVLRDALGPVTSRPRNPEEFAAMLRLELSG